LAGFHETARAYVHVDIPAGFDYGMRGPHPPISKLQDSFCDNVHLILMRQKLFGPTIIYFSYLEISQGAARFLF
jgi:hypothetical protein